jgi:hypothetical protein
MSNVLKFPNRATLVRRYVEVGRELWSLDERLDSERIAEMQRHVQGMDDDALAEQIAAGLDQLGATATVSEAELAVHDAEGPF